MGKKDRREEWTKIERKGQERTENRKEKIIKEK